MSGAAEAPAPGPAPTARGAGVCGALMAQVRRLYDWVLSWADTPHGATALFLLAFAESSVFPVPPDVLLIALCIGRPDRGLRFAVICSVGSVLGGVAGYGIGVFASDLGREIIAWFGPHYLRTAEDAFAQHGGWAVAIAGFTPVPYKVFTIASGIFHEQISLPVFVTASVLSRSARFLLVAGLIRVFGPPIKALIDRWFNVLSIVFVVLLLGGFWAMRWATG